MNDRVITIRTERPGRPASVDSGLRVDDIARVIGRLEGEIDVTVTISKDESQGRLMLAVSGTDAFLALARPDGIFQYTGNSKNSKGRAVLVIGKQDTHIHDRYVIGLPAAISAIEEWLQEDGELSPVSWERQ